MQAIAPYSEWVRWWGGEQIFQQSPLYAYLLASLGRSVLPIRIVQAVMTAATCVSSGLLTARIAGRRAGWTAFWLAALYAPYYAYSWPLLRDSLAWFIGGALLLALVELDAAQWPSAASRRLGWAVGALLGLGYLARETYAALIPVFGTALVILSHRRRDWSAVTRIGTAMALAIVPLIVRNHAVGAPLLSTSTRFAETFIVGNAGSSHPSVGIIPDEMGAILRETEEKPLRVVRTTIASHQHGVLGWLRLEGSKLLSLADPYESPDNLSIYFVETISPVVRFGLRYWMILVPGLAGCALAMLRGERSHLWLWLFLAVMLPGLLVGVALSRYRQSLAVVLIPWAAYFFSCAADAIRRRALRVAAVQGVVLALGWLLVLGPLARQPWDKYERPAEYLLAAQIYRELGREADFHRMLGVIHDKFPALQVETHEPSG